VRLATELLNRRFANEGDPETQNGRHGVDIGVEIAANKPFDKRAFNYFLSRIAHEMGHIMGLDHEHQVSSEPVFNIDALLIIPACGP
jgi:hypothetical protein